MIFTKSKIFSLVFTISLFLCQSSMCNVLQELFVAEAYSSPKCHETSHEISHDKMESGIAYALLSLNRNTSCCYNSSLNSVNLIPRVLSLSKFDFKISFQTQATTNFKLVRIINRGHPPPDIYGINSSLLI